MLIAKVKNNIVKKDLKVRKFNSIFKRKIYSLELLKIKKNFSKIEFDNFVINNLILTEILFIGHQSDIAKNIIENLNVSKNSTQHPDSLGVGKLASCIISNKISINKTTYAFDKLKPIYARPAQINLK